MKSSNEALPHFTSQTLMQNGDAINASRKNHRLIRWLFDAIYLHILALFWVGVRFSWTGFPGGVSRFSPIAPSAPGFSAGILATEDLLATYLLSFGVLPSVISAYGLLTAYQVRRAQEISRQKSRAIAGEKANHLSLIGSRILLTISTALIITWPIQYILWVTRTAEASSTVFYCVEFLNYYLWFTLIACSWIAHRSVSVLLGISISAITVLTTGTLFWVIGVGHAAFLSVLVLGYHYSTHLRDKRKRTKHSQLQLGENFDERDGEALEVENQTKPTQVFSVFLLGGLLAYAMACFVSLIAASGNRNPENWGVYIPLFLGLWLIPIVGTLTAVINQLTGPWAWQQKHHPRKLACYAALLCLLIWAAIVAI